MLPRADTACSSSLVTTHLASAAMAASECTHAVAAGVNLCLVRSDHASRLGQHACMQLFVLTALCMSKGTHCL